ncbi:MAG TPA: hypothetical protein PLE54_05410 [Burkholderiaceae bacterium]|nr:hypothetical protein [Burkholderiaceae bacterium]HQR70020.1 hypothetical protein [Burkholderiaceae bacterium]
MLPARSYPLWLSGAVVSAVLAGCGGGGGYIDFEAMAPQVSVAIMSARNPLIAGQSSAVQAAVVNTSQNEATNVLVQVAAPIGFEYRSVTCLSSGASICPPVSVQQLAGGLPFPSFPAGTEVSFFFDGVTTGAAGSQVMLVVTANVPGDMHPEDNSAVRYVPVVSAP